ncbi:MAG: NADH-quinone oxidoreductase subunit F, partial [Pyrinomonadaceae bacterium]|nr:NADH-quinone oxidoreductase subunit F [Pyrinomonadaceae bacterium]
MKDILAGGKGSLDEYVRAGGYEVARRVACHMAREEVIAQLDAAGLRGRAGGGYPTAHKWWLVSRKESTEKYFICNANAGQPGGFKERFLLSMNPHRVIEAVVAGALAVGARTAFIVLPLQFSDIASSFRAALREAVESNFVGRNL